MLQPEQVTRLFKGDKILPQNAVKTVSGATAKRVVVVYRPNGADATEPEKIMLQKLITACKIQPQEAEIINNGQAQLSLASLQMAYHPSFVLLFGDTGAGIHLAGMKPNTPFNLSGTKIMKTLSLDKLISNDREKAALWKALQVMFGL